MVDAALEEAIQACENAIKKGLPVYDKIAFIQQYLKYNRLFRHFVNPIPAEWIEAAMKEQVQTC